MLAHLFPAILGLMNLKPLKTGEFRYAVVIREGLNLWLALWVARSQKGDFVVLVPRPGFDPKWTPHATYHVSGTHHIKSYGQVTVSRKGQPLTGAFQGGESLASFGGHGPGLEPYNERLFNGAVVVEPGVLTATHGTVCVDLVEPGYDPTTNLPYSKIVQREVFSHTVPNVVITIWN
jgi:hypothetical protein